MPKVGKDAFLEKDRRQKHFLDYADAAFKKKILSALDNAQEQQDCLQKKQMVLESALKQEHFAQFDKKNNLVENCILSYLLEQGIESFKVLSKINLTLRSPVPGCPKALSFYDYYQQRYHSQFWQYLVDNIDELKIDDLDELRLVPDLIVTNAPLADIDVVLEKGRVWIGSQILSISQFKSYINSFPNRTLKTKILTTANLFESMHARTQVQKLLDKPHYTHVYNEKGNTVLHELAEAGYEKECIKLLSREKTKEPKYNAHLESIWHIAVRNNLNQLLTFLLETQKNNIDCLNANNLSPWGLAIMLDNSEMATLLKDKGANTALFINEQGQTVLHSAVVSGDDELLNRCYDCATAIDVVDLNGYTPLYYACLKEDKELYQFLKKFPGAKRAEEIDFFNAITKGDIKALQSLLSQGVNPHLNNNLKRSGLDVALIYQRKEIAAKLKKLGVKKNLTETKIKHIRQGLNASPHAIEFNYDLNLKKTRKGIELVISELNALCHQNHQDIISPWANTASIHDLGKWKIIRQSDSCHVILMNPNNPQQPDMVCVLSVNGDINLTFANLPNARVNFSTYANFAAESLACIKQCRVNAKKIITAKQCKFLNGASLKLAAEDVVLEGMLSFKEVEVDAKNEFKQSANFVTEKLEVQSKTLNLHGQTVASKMFSFEAKGTFNHFGQLIAGHQGNVKALSIQLARNSVIVIQQGSLKLYGEARINNLGALIGDQVSLKSNVIITNNIGAMVKGLHCRFHAPQVNQAGFLLTGQKTTLSPVDWVLNGLHAGVNLLELCSYIPAPNAIALRGYLLLGKTLYRGGELLNRGINGEEIQNIELVSLILDNIVPSIGFMSSSDEKATLLVNLSYQFYGALYSEEEFIYKSLELIETLTRAVSVYSGGLLSAESAEWLQTAAKIINGSRYALRIADASIAAYQAWYEEDEDALERAQAHLGAVSEAIFREALYKLAPSELLGSNLAVKPIDIIHFILNQGHNSDQYLQSIVYGALHAAQRAGVIEPEFQNDLQVGARFLFRMKHWQTLFKDFQEDRLSTHAVVNEALNSLMVILSSDRTRAFLNKADEPKDVLQMGSEVEQEVAILLVEEPLTDMTPIVTEASVVEPARQLTSEDTIEKINADVEQYKHVIPEHPKQVLTLDIDEITEKNVESLPSTASKDDVSITLLKSLFEVQKALNGEYAANGYLGIFAGALHNEGIIEVTGDIGLNVSNNGTNNGSIKATRSIGLYGSDIPNRTQEGAILSQKIAATINTHFTNFESGTIDAGEAIYLTCIGLIENFGEIKALRRINTTASRIIKNHQSGRIISKKDVKLLCDLLAKNEGIIVGEEVHFEGKGKQVLNAGTILGVEKIRLISEKLVTNTKGGKLVSKRVNFEASEISKEGTVQAEMVKTQNVDGSSADKVSWRKDEEDSLGVVALRAESYAIDKDAFNKTQVLDVTLKEHQLLQESLFEISPDFSNILQLHLEHSDKLIPIWQLPKMQSSATLILDAPGAKLSSVGTHNAYDSALYFIGDKFEFSADLTTFSSLALFDVRQIQGLGATSVLDLKTDGLLQADSMVNQGYIHSDGILSWNVDSLQNDAQLAYTTEYFTYSKHNPELQACPTISVVENSGTVSALGHQGYVGNFTQLGGTFKSGLEGNHVYFANSVQEAILTQHGENPTGILHDAGQNWYIKPVWRNAEVSSTGQNIFIGSGTMHVGGLSFWGDEFGYLVPQGGLLWSEKSQRYEIDQIFSLKKHGKVNGVMHEHEIGYVPVQNDLSSNSGNLVVAAPEGSIHLANVVISSAGSTTLAAKDEVSIDGITLDKHSAYAYKNSSLFRTKSVKSSTEEKIVYSSFIFTGGELIIRCQDFSLGAVQGAIGSADIVAYKTTLSGLQQTYDNTTITREFSITSPGSDLVSVLKSHNAKAIFAGIMGACGWDQQELENLLHAKSITEIPKPLLNTARNAWNISALVAYACAEYGDSPADFVGTFTDQMGLTYVDGDAKRHFNPRFSIHSSKTIQETQKTQTISTELFVGGTFRLSGNELHLLDGAMVDAEDLRIFLLEGINATKATNTSSSASKTTKHSIGINLANPKDLSVSASKGTRVEHVTETSLAKLHARNTAEIDAGDHIKGDLLIEGEKGGKVVAEEMSFSTSQHTKTLTSHSKGGTVSTAVTVSGHYRSDRESERTTVEKAGIILPGGEVSANTIHLENGSKIETSHLSRVNAQEGLPSVTGTTATDHHSQQHKSASLNLSLNGKPSGDLEYSSDAVETVHRPTVLADNVGPQDLPGINTEAEKETEITHQHRHGVAVAGFVPDKEKIQSDLAVMKKAVSKGLHWMFKPNPVQPLAQTVSALSTDEPLAQTVTELATDESLVQARKNLPAEESLSIDFHSLLITQGMPPSLVVESMPTPDAFCLSLGDGPLPIYQFPYGELSSIPVPYNIIKVDNSLIQFHFDNDETIPIYQTSQSNERSFYDYNPETRRFHVYIDGRPYVPKPREPFRLPSAVPAYDENPVWNHVFAFCRSVEKSRDMAVDALLHPIETIVDTGTLVWDGINAVSLVRFGIVNQEAHQRNLERLDLLNQAFDDFKTGDSVTRTEMLFDIALPMLFTSNFGRGGSRYSRKGILIEEIPALESFDWKNLLLPEYNVYHSVSSPNRGQSVLNGINPRFLGTESRFGKGFYVSEIPDTTLYELKHNKLQASHTIRYTVNSDKIKVLDLSDKKIAADWEYKGGERKEEYIKMGELAQKLGYNAIKFPSVRGPGHNIVVLKDFHEILQHKMVVPSPSLSDLVPAEQTKQFDNLLKLK
ncbi:ankyrin repeat domain-containing protein [Candidatus Berkiella aquae]|uniref:Ankyrin repeats (3 copies) n=1 Tax=Candidatus Berkiella aquae TaxID=295108 RepID=A0AAE3L947_9GAMM|nr:ankyrin repeat domain-containing protein [Candidatus Berkiella aquae]MCS5710539.1 hypothetical protein [Candidatus Berkiella aquae]